MFKEVFTVARGNTTLLVEGCPMDQWLDLARKALRQVEQVGFVSTYNGLPTIEMMGGELSVNATIAFARKLGGEGKLKTSGLREQVDYYQDQDRTSIKIRMPYELYPERLGTVARFEGIGYLCTERLAVPNEAVVRDLCNKYDLPAFGLAMYSGDAITPFVYVRETDSLIPETACGSGSIAVSIVTGKNEIIQPTLQRISVLIAGKDKFIVSAKVRRAGRINEPLRQKPALESTIA